MLHREPLHNLERMPQLIETVDTSLITVDTSSGGIQIQINQMDFHLTDREAAKLADMIARALDVSTLPRPATGTLANVRARMWKMFDSSQQPSVKQGC